MTLRTTMMSLAGAGVLIAGAAAAQDLRIAPAAPPAHPAYYMYEHFAEYLAEESGGAMTATIIGPEVVALPQMADALQTGLADVGNVLPLYFAADFPITGIAGDLALLGRNPHAMALAMTEWTVNCAECLAEFKDFGGVFTGAGSSDVYGLITTVPVESVEDLQGLRLRSGGAPYSRWAENFGATGVPMGVGDTFEAMSQGTIDGTMASIVDMLSFRLIDVATNFNTVPIGTYHATSNMTIAIPTWERMSVEERGMFLRAANRANFDLTDRWAFQLPEAARGAVNDSDVVVTEASDELIAASEDFAAADRDAQIAEAGDLAADFAALVDEWSALIADIGNDPDALADLAWERIWSNVDLSTYGL
ncbi:C4-dicarboxylate ABC transporter substrate-binding protein [Rhodobacterales bacterium HKCCE3408]|nr:C4-dicarboxylate ABC transporter substrate-binding protein [Rhodobacterales bacterium HKCCE3408]